MAEALLDEDPRVMAAGLAHEFTHASDFDLIAVGLLQRDCTELEVRAFAAQAIITRALRPDELPGGSACSHPNPGTRRDGAGRLVRVGRGGAGAPLGWTALLSCPS